MNKFIHHAWFLAEPMETTFDILNQYPAHEIFGTLRRTERIILPMLMSIDYDLSSRYKLSVTGRKQTFAVKFQV